MVCLKKANGYSLTEILVCMMLIGLIVIFILPSITFGYLQINNAGEKTRAVYNARQMTENELVNQVTPGPDMLSIKFGSVEINVKGCIQETEQSYGSFGEKTRLRVFIPDK